LGCAVSDLSGDVFAGCLSLTAFAVSGQNAVLSALDGVLFNKEQTVLVQYPPAREGGYQIPDSVITINDKAIQSCRFLAELTIPRGVVAFDYASLNDCVSLQWVSVDVDNPSYCSVNGVLFDHEERVLLVYPRGRTGGYEVPSSVLTIADKAFARCAGLTDVIFHEGVRRIGDEAFLECIALGMLALPDSLVDIGNRAFAGCSGVVEIGMGTRVSNIGNGAFESCKKIYAMTLAGSVTNIGYHTFWGCDSLRYCLFKGNAPYPLGQGMTQSAVFGGWCYLFYLPGASGWRINTDGCLTQPWDPRIHSAHAADIKQRGFGFAVKAAMYAPVAVEMATNLVAAEWMPVQTNIMNTTKEWSFVDFASTNAASRYYRLCWPY
jgi:hypothetical protein